MKYIVLCAFFCASSLFSLNYHGCTLAPDNVHGWVVCLDTALIFHTTNGGADWQQQSVPTGTERIFDVTCVSEFSAWTCGILGEILHTDNGGADWYGQIIGLSKYATRIEFIDANYGWAACGDGVVGRTVDAGSFWEQVFTPWYSAEFYGTSFINQWDGWIVAGYPDSMLTGQGLVLRSTNGGIEWDSLYQASAYEDFFDVHLFDAMNGIVIGGNENDYSPIIMRTTNGGLNWEQLPAPGNAYYLRAVDFVGNEGWAVGRFGTVIHTTDGGTSWSFQTNPATNTLFDVDFSDNTHGLACGYNIILYTTDGGQTWNPAGIMEENRSMDIPVVLKVFPNPFRSRTVIQCAVNSMPNDRRDEESMNLDIHDAAGRLVKSHELPAPHSLPPAVISWDGSDEYGRQVPEGVYFLSVKTPDATLTEKVIRVR